MSSLVFQLQRRIAELRLCLEKIKVLVRERILDVPDADIEVIATFDALNEPIFYELNIKRQLAEIYLHHCESALREYGKIPNWSQFYTHLPRFKVPVIPEYRLYRIVNNEIKLISCH
jgi:hypothetical protein